VDFTFFTVRRLPTPDDRAGITPIGQALLIRPAGRGLKPFTLTIPSHLIPRGFQACRVRLHRVSRRSDPGPGRGMQAAVSGPKRWDGKGAHFKLPSISPSTIQPYVTEGGPCK